MVPLVPFGTARKRLDGTAARPLLTVPNVTAHPSTASIPITLLLYNGSSLCSFNVATKGLIVNFEKLTLTRDLVVASTN